MREAWIVAEAAGRHLLGLPLAANMAVLPTLCAAGAGGRAAQWAAEMMAGDTYFADAALRPDGSAFIEGAGEGVRALALRPTGAAGLRLELHAPVAGQAGLDPTMPVARVRSPEVLESLDPDLAPGAWTQLRTRLRLLRCAELLGAASAALDAAAAYARERRQFDRAIGANQAVKHRLAEDWMALDDARLAGVAAAAAHDAGAASAEPDSLYAPLLAVEAGRRAAQNAIQVHGALGVTWECDAHLYLKRVLRLAACLEAEASGAELLERIWEGGGEGLPA
jgi:alkylation response protein AidB-like acyl-CoA dehydrogenase